MKPGNQQAFSDRRVLLSIVVSAGSLILGLLAFGGLSVVFAQPQRMKSGANFTRATANFTVIGQDFWAQPTAPKAETASH